MEKPELPFSFFHYAQYIGNMLFADYAMDLIGEMRQLLNKNNAT
jgi:hypothetical protein